jgi:hypothetical protein
MNDDTLIIIALIIALVGLFLLPQIFFLLTLQKALSRCQPRNRTMSPGLVWLDLVPLVNIVWTFVAVIRVAESLKNEFRDRGMHRRKEDYGYGLGIAAYVALIVVGLPGFIVWIIYWVKIANLSKRIAHPAWEDEDDYDGYYHEDDRPRRRDDYEDDYEDERPRQRRDRDDDDYEEDRPRSRRRRDRDDEDDRDERKPWERGR